VKGYFYFCDSNIGFVYQSGAEFFVYASVFCPFYVMGVESYVSNIASLKFSVYLSVN
jgi:hypothetical protein